MQDAWLILTGFIKWSIWTSERTKPNWMQRNEWNWSVANNLKINYAGTGAVFLVKFSVTVGESINFCTMFSAAVAHDIALSSRSSVLPSTGQPIFAAAVLATALADSLFAGVQHPKRCFRQCCCSDRMLTSHFGWREKWLIVWHWVAAVAADSVDAVVVKFVRTQTILVSECFDAINAPKIGKH